MSDLTRYDGPPPPAAQGGTAQAATNERPKTLAYSLAVVFSGWADLPGGPAGPAGMVFDHAWSETVSRSGDVVQRVTAWALGRDVLARCVCERALRRRPDGRFEPAGKWRAQADELPVTGLARLRPAGEGGSGQAAAGTRAEVASDPFDVLPASVKRLLAGAGGTTTTHAILWHDAPGSPDGREDVRSLGIGQRFVVAVRAQRRREGQVVGPWDLAVWRAERAAPGLPAGGRREVAGGARKALQR